MPKVKLTKPYTKDWGGWATTWPEGTVLNVDAELYKYLKDNGYLVDNQQDSSKSTKGSKNKSVKQKNDK